ncbi:MAG: hypothetical protein KF688_18245 [Pirellulales bacterium]|nr:hypothetical protein [Pirellulales bacterium]MBX3433129.1 hypothetical protein [Pirellulales bacterium]
MQRRLRPEYLPTPREIARLCAVIRDSWSPSERRRRTVDRDLLIAHEPAWMPPTIDTASCLARVRHAALEHSA